jgi:hypothetical protein
MNQPESSQRRHVPELTTRAFAEERARKVCGFGMLESVHMAQTPSATACSSPQGREAGKGLGSYRYATYATPRLCGSLGIATTRFDRKRDSPGFEKRSPRLSITLGNIALVRTRSNGPLPTAVRSSLKECTQ